jgi:hypothetical protein
VHAVFVFKDEIPKALLLGATATPLAPFVNLTQVTVGIIRKHSFYKR